MDGAYLFKRREIIFKIYPKVWNYFSLYKKEIERILTKANIIYELETGTILGSENHQTIKFRFLANDTTYKFLVKVLNAGFEYEAKKLEMETIEK